MRLVDAEAGSAVEVIEPRGLLGRVRGLLGERGLPPGRGMLLRAKQVHTLGMRFAIDAVYLSAAGVVLRVATLRPWTVGPLVFGARWVLELAQGEAARLGIAEGRILVREG